MEHVIPELSIGELRKFGISTGVLIATLFGLFIPWMWDFGYPTWPWIIFAILAILGVIVPKALRPVYKNWMRFGLLLSKITTPIILGVVFFGVLLPMALVMKIMKRDPLARSLIDDAASYRVESKVPDKQHLEKPF